MCWKLIGKGDHSLKERSKPYREEGITALLSYLIIFEFAFRSENRMPFVSGSMATIFTNFTAKDFGLPAKTNLLLVIIKLSSLVGKPQVSRMPKARRRCRTPFARPLSLAGNSNVRRYQPMLLVGKFVPMGLKHDPCHHAGRMAIRRPSHEANPVCASSSNQNLAA